MTEEKGNYLIRFFEDLDLPAGILDQNGQVVFANRAAREIFCDESEPHKDAHEALWKILGWIRATGRDWRGVLVESDDVQWIVRAWSLGGKSVAFLGRPSQQRPTEIARLGAAYGLEPSGARLALRIAQGLTNEAIGDRLGVALSTIKSRTFTLYRKLGVRNRVELTALVLSSLSEPQGADSPRKVARPA